MNKCEHYAASSSDDQTELTGDGAEWRTFFEYYHKVVDDNQKFAAPADDAELGALTTASRRALERLAARRPQTAMDGRQNVWTIKCNQPTDRRPCSSNRIDDILERCGRTDGDYVVQKHVETPLLVKNDRFDVRAWLVVSTLDRSLAVWLCRTCSVHRRSHRLPVDPDRGLQAHVPDTKSQRHTICGPVQTCGLRQLKGKLRAVAAPAAKNRGDSAPVWQTIRRSVVSAVLAATDVLNLRPNCFELFQATFVIGDDFHPWLIDIESDPWIARSRQHPHSESSVAGSVAKGLAKILIRRHRTPQTKIGVFDLLYRGPIPGEPYEPRPFSERPIAKKRDRTKTKAHDIVRQGPDDFINTYVEKIQVNDTSDYRPASNISVNLITNGSNLKRYDAVLENDLCLSDLEESMTRLKAGPRINKSEASHCLYLLDKWKTKVMSAQRFYKTVLTSNRT